MKKDVFPASVQHRSCGPMDKASAYGAGDCRFESYRDHLYPLRDKASGKQPHAQVLVSAGGPSVFSAPQLVCPDQFTAQRGSRVDLTDPGSNLAEQLGRSRGPMDKASAYGAGDCRFESYRGQWYKGSADATGA